MYDAAPALVADAPTAIADLCAKLNARKELWRNGTGFYLSDTPDAVCAEAAATLESQQAEVERLTRERDSEQGAAAIRALMGGRQMKETLTRAQKIERMVELDIESVMYFDGDHSFLRSILCGDGWTQYNNLTNEQVDEEYNARDFE